jgi:hypothetical protein
MAAESETAEAGSETAIYLPSAAIANLFDQLFTDANRAALERLIINLSGIGFAVHLLLLFVGNAIPAASALRGLLGTSYVAAIYTPFSFILFHEVLTMIWSIPQSTTQSLGRQFEIVSLIFIRGFFKDIAALDVNRLRQPSQELVPPFLDMALGLLMFLLVVVFRRIAFRDAAKPAYSREVPVFVRKKKVVAFGLTVLFAALAAYRLGEFALDAYGLLRHRAVEPLDLKAFYFHDVFSVMVFTDVLILIFSLHVSERYELVCRNAAFVIARILVRFSLLAGTPFGAIFGIAGIACGIITVLIYNYALEKEPRRHAMARILPDT